MAAIGRNVTMYIRLAHRLAMLRPTLHNGPGWRVGLWTQGCVHRCTKDCLNPDFLDPSGGFLFLVDDAIAEVLAAVREAPQPVEGITVLGGEPFEQAAAVRAMLKPL